MSTFSPLPIHTPSSLSLREQLKTDLKTAFKARQSHAVTALRSVLGEIDNAEAIALDDTMGPVVGKFNERPRKQLTEAQIQDILRADAETIRVSLAEYQLLGKTEEAAQLQAEWEVLAKYLSSTEN